MTDTPPKKPYGLLALDIETTGLDPQKDEIIEIAWMLLEFSYPYGPIAGDPRPPYYAGSRVVRPVSVTDRYMLDSWMARLSPFICDMHEKSGLFEELRRWDLVTWPLVTVEKHLLDLSANWPLGKDERVILFGNSVHFDLAFLRVHMPHFAARLSHRVFDVSAISLCARSLGMPKPDMGEPVHRALADIAASHDQLLRCLMWLDGRGDPERLDTSEEFNAYDRQLLEEIHAAVTPKPPQKECRARFDQYKCTLQAGHTSEHADHSGRWPVLFSERQARYDGDEGDTP